MQTGAHGVGGGGVGGTEALHTPASTLDHELNNSPPPTACLLATASPQAQRPFCTEMVLFGKLSPFWTRASVWQGMGFVGQDSRALQEGRIAPNLRGAAGWGGALRSGQSSLGWLKVKLCRVPKARAEQFIEILLPG